MESNVNSYKLEQHNKEYILTTSVIDNELKISCKIITEPTMIFSRTFTVEALQKLDEMFKIIQTPLDAIKWIDKALKVQKVGVIDEPSSFKIKFVITSKGIRNRIDIPLTQEGEIASISVNEETKANIFEESNEIQKVTSIDDNQFSREIGLDPSKVLRHTSLGDKASQILSSLEEEQKIILSQINYNVNNTNDSYTPQNEENTNINIGTTFDSFPAEDQGYQITEKNDNIIPTVTNNEINNQYEGTNYDLNQYSNTNVQEDMTNLIGNTNEILTDSTAQYTTIDNNYTVPETSTQYNAGEYTESSVSAQYAESSNQYTSTYDYSNNVELPAENGEIQTTTGFDSTTRFDSKPYITPSDDTSGQLNQFTTNTTTTNYENYDQGTTGENYDQGTTGENYEQYFSNTTENIPQYNESSYANAEYNTVETGNIETYGVESTGNIENLGINIDGTNITENQTNDIDMLKTKVDELMGFKSQMGELNKLKEKIDQMDLVQTQAEEIKQLKSKIAELTSPRKSEEKTSEEELKNKIKELEDIKLKQEQEIKNLKLQSAKKSEIKEEKEEKEEREEKEEKEIKQEVKEIKQEVKQEIEEKTKEAPQIEKRHIFGEKIQKYKVKGDIIHNKDEIEMITRKINKVNKKITLNLIYKATVDSDKASAFHEKCDAAKSSLVLVQTDKGKRFGGFTTSSWSGDCVDKKDEDAFIFSLDKMKVYSNIPDEDAIGCYPKYGPIFLGCQIRIYDNAFTKGGTTFKKGLNFNTEENYELTDGDREFKVKEIEVYEVVAE